MNVVRRGGGEKYRGAAEIGRLAPPPGRDAPGAWADIDFNSPLARRLARDFSWLGVA